MHNPVFSVTLPEPAIHADFRDTTPSPPPAACGAGTGSPARSWRTADDGSSESRGSAPSRSQRCASESGTDVPPSLALWPSPGSWPFVTRPQNSCIALSAGHILRSRSRLPDGFALSLISTVAPHLALLAVQQIRQHVLVRHRSRRRAHRMHMASLRVHSDVGLQPEVQLLALARMMHFRIALSAPVLG